MSTVAMGPRWTLTTLVLVATCFALAAGNGYRIWISSLPFVVALALLAIAVRGHERVGWPALRRFTGEVFATVLIFFVAGASSWLATAPDADSNIAFAASFLSPVFITVAMLGERWDATDLWRAVTALLVGAAIVLVHGIFRFYTEFGIPTGLDLVFARAQEVRIEPYLRATWGNVGSTAAWLALLMPPAMAAAVWGEAPRSTRRIAYVVVALGLVNFAIIQSRTLLLVLAASVIVVARVFRTRFRTLLVVAAITMTLVLAPLFTVLDTVYEYLAGALQGPSGDTSVAERTEAMRIGWRMMLESPLHGVGPGRTALLNPYTSAHEFLLQLGSELGVPGFLAATVATFVTWRVFVAACRRGATTAGRLGVVLGIGPAAYMLYAFLANAPLSQGAVSSWVGLWAGLLTLAAGWLDRTGPMPASASRDAAAHEGSR